MKNFIFALGALALGGTLSVKGSTFTVTVSVIEDGQDNLILQGNTLSWQHLALFSNGGVCATVQAGGCATTGALIETDYVGASVDVNNPLILVSGTDSSDAGQDFTSGWYNGIQGFACTNDSSGGSKAVLPCPFTPPVGFDLMLPSPYTLNELLGSVTLTVLDCAGAAGSTCPGNILTRDPTPTLTQPTSGNGEKATVAINDVPDSGTHEFEVQLTWTDAPEPGTFAFCGLGLIVVGLIAPRLDRFRRQRSLPKP